MKEQETEGDTYKTSDIDVLVVLARLCASTADTPVDEDMWKTATSLSGRSSLAWIFSLRAADRRRLGKRLCRLLVRAIEFRDSCYDTPHSLSEDEAILEALKGPPEGARRTCDAMEDLLLPPLGSQQTISVPVQTTTAVAVRLGERRVLYAVKEFLAGLDTESDGDSPKCNNQKDGGSQSRQKRQRVSECEDL